MEHWSDTTLDVGIGAAYTAEGFTPQRREADDSVLGFASDPYTRA